MNGIKKKIAMFIFKRKYKSKKIEAIPFNKFLSSAEDFVFIMPDDQNVEDAFDVVKYFIINKKNVTLFYHASKSTQYDQNIKSIKYNDEEISRLELPAKELTAKLKEKEYDIVIDLNRSENFFLSVVANTINSKFRVGFRKNDSDEFYNFQVANNQNNAEISYRNLLNSLLMF